MIKHTVVREYSRVALIALLTTTRCNDITPGASTLSRWAATPGDAA